MNQRTTLDVAREVFDEYDSGDNGRKTLTVDEKAGTWRLELVTGGWSENEAFIDGLWGPNFSRSRVAWAAMCWQSTHRGGLHVFEGRTDQSYV